MDWKFNQALPVWWSFVWRASLYGVAAGLLIRFAAFVFGKSGAIDMPGAMSLANIATAMSYLAISLVAMRQALSRHAQERDA